jgi:hypothetical protein
MGRQKAKRAMHNSLDDDIRLTVDRAIRTGDMLEITDVAERLAAAHPEAKLDAAAIGEILLRAGIGARVPLGWGGPKINHQRDEAA